VVAVEVADENLHFAVETHFGAHHLVLDVFSAVKHPLTLWTLNHNSGQAAL
jgi:tRNA U34 5-methylaminomethyl-2-thiouridine-forming methyltransferase MnmC